MGTSALHLPANMRLTTFGAKPSLSNCPNKFTAPWGLPARSNPDCAEAEGAHTDAQRSWIMASGSL